MNKINFLKIYVANTQVTLRSELYLRFKLCSAQHQCWKDPFCGIYWYTFVRESCSMGLARMKRRGRPCRACRCSPSAACAGTGSPQSWPRTLGRPELAARPGPAPCSEGWWPYCASSPRSCRNTCTQSNDPRWHWQEKILPVVVFKVLELPVGLSIPDPHREPLLGAVILHVSDVPVRNLGPLTNHLNRSQLSHVPDFIFKLDWCR